MLTDDQLIAYLAGTLPPEERARVEEALAGNPEALRRVLEQEQLDASLQRLLRPATNREQVKASILAGIRTAPVQVSADEVMKRVLLESGKGAWAYRPRRDEPVPGVFTVLVTAFREWLQTNHSRVVIYGALAVLLVFVASELRISRVRTGPMERQANTFEGSRKLPPAVAQVPAATRAPAQWPFAADSVWNTPIGSGAQFANVQPGGLDLATGVMIVNASQAHPVFATTTNDPMANCFLLDEPTPFTQMPLPAAMAKGIGFASHAFLVLPDGATAYELTHVRVSGTDLRVNSAVRADLRGSGVPPEFVGATSSGLTPLAGSIRRGEFRGGIRHVIGSVAPVEAVARRTDGTAHVWPAARSQAEVPTLATRMASSGNVHVGTLLAIPPNVDLTLLAAPGTVAYEVMRAMQDYGVLVKDTFDGAYFMEWQREGAPHLVFCAEDLFNGDAPRDLPRQLAPAIRELRVVANHGPNNLGGGGPRRQPAAPPFGR